MALDVSRLRQLSIVRYMFKQGLEQSRLPAPQLSLALLLFQDAVELFLHVACEHHGVTVGKNQFEQYWELLKPHHVVTQGPGLAKLNRARVQLKHHALFPSDQDMEAFRTLTASFFEENTKPLFGIDFDSISLVELVRDDEARKYLAEAESCFARGEAAEAAKNLAFAFDSVLVGYERRNSKNGRSSYLMEFGASPFYRVSGSPSGGGGDGFSMAFDRFVSGTHKAIESIQHALRLVVYGIDFRRYARFRSLTPIVQRFGEGGLQAMMTGGQRPLAAKGDFDFCFGFVIDSSIKIEQFDYYP